MSNYVPPTTPIGQQPQVPGGPPPPGYYQGQPPPPQQPKSKTWIWVLGGCGAVMLLGAIVAGVLGFMAYRKVQDVASDMEKNPTLTVAKWAVAANPDVELVSVDEDKGVMVIKDKKTGKQITVNFEDASNGKFVFQEDGKDSVTLQAKGEGESGSVEVKSAEGSVKVGSGSSVDLPGWLPPYPGAVAQGNYSMKANDGQTGAFHFSTSDSVERVMAFYEAELKSAGLTVQTTKAGGAFAAGVVTAEERSNKRTVTVTLGSDKGATQVNVVFVVKD